MENLELLMEELREFLEPKMINSYNLFNQISRPRGYGDSYLIGAQVGYRGHMNEVGCTLLDMGETEQGHLGICFRFDRTGQEFQAVSGFLSGGDRVDFDIFALEQWVTNESL